MVALINESMGFPVPVGGPVGKVMLDGSPGKLSGLGWECWFPLFEPNCRGRRSAMMGLRRYKLQ